MKGHAHGDRARPHTLFSFGTLLDQQVQTSLFGRVLPTTAASLAGYTTKPLAITDESVIAASGQVTFPSYRGGHN